MGTKDVGRSRVVLVQGHPEYDPSSLLREYHRDARRYLHLERDDLPCLPLDCVAPEDWDRLADLQCRMVGGERDPALIEAIPFDQMGERAPWPWRGVAIGLYTNWMAGVPDRSECMHDETIAIHGGYTADGTRAVAVPIYQTVAHDFIDAEHAGAVLDLEVPGFHYNRINNPTNDVLERRIAALEGGTAALVLASGMAAVSYSILTVARAGSNLVVAPQLYGATFTYFAHVLPTLGIEARFAADDRAESIGPLIDADTCAVFCETIGNPAGNIVDLEAVAAVAHQAGVPLIVDNTVATP